MKEAISINITFLERSGILKTKSLGCPKNARSHWLGQR
jgi:hypothetical protein